MNPQEIDTMEHLEKQIAELNKSVNEIKTALLGNEFNKDGIVSTVNDHEERISALEQNENTQKTYINIMKFIAGVITTGVLGFLISLVLKK